MDELLQRFAFCCDCLQKGHELTALHVEVEDILNNPSCWEMCMILLCTSAAMPTADRLYRNFVAAKMVHLLVDRSWTQLPHPFQSTVKKELLSVYLAYPATLNSPDTGMLCRVCAAILSKTNHDAVDTDCSQLLFSAVSGPDAMLRVIGLLKEVAIELCASANNRNLSFSPTVVTKFRYFVLSILVNASCRCAHLQSALDDAGRAMLHSAQCSELISSLSLLDASLDCLLSWSSGVIGFSVEDDQEIDEDENGDRISYRHLTTIRDIVDADENPTIITILNHLSAPIVYQDILGRISVSSLLCEKLLPLVMNFGTACSRQFCVDTNSTFAFVSSISDKCESSAEKIADALQFLFKSFTADALLQQSLKVSGSSDSVSQQKLAGIKELCRRSTEMVSSLAAFWEVFIGVRSWEFVNSLTSWSMQDHFGDYMNNPAAADPVLGFLFKVHSRLQSDDFCCNLLWREKYRSTMENSYEFSHPSAFLVSLVELTIFVCEKQSALFFGKDLLFADSRRDCLPGLFSGAMSEAIPSDVTTAGKVSWLALVYVMLAIPDNKLSTLLVSEILCYFQDSAPEDIMNKTPSELLASSSGNLFRSFPRVITKLLLLQCKYSASIKMKTLVTTCLKRSSLNLNEGSDTETDEDRSELYHNACALRCEGSMIVRNCCLFTLDGKDVILDICGDIMANWQQLLTNCTIAVPANDIQLFYGLEAKMYLLYTVGDVVMNDIEKFESTPAVSFGRFRSARSDYSVVVGPDSELIPWIVKWLVLSMTISHGAKQYDAIVASLRNSHPWKLCHVYRNFLFRQQLSTVWTIVPFFIRSIHKYQGSADRSAVVSGLVSMIQLFLADLDLGKLNLCRPLGKENMDIASLTITMADLSLTALESIAMTLYGSDDDCENAPIGMLRPAVLANTVFTDPTNIGELLQSCIGIEVVSNVMALMAGINAHNISIARKYFDVLLRVVNRYYGLIGRLLVCLCLTSSDKVTVEQSTDFLTKQLHHLFNGLKTQSNTAFQHVWRHVLCHHTSTAPSFRTGSLISTLEELGYPFFLPLSHHLVLIGSDASAEGDLWHGITMATASAAAARFMCSGLNGLQIGLSRNKILSSIWTSLVSQGGGFELLLSILEESFNLEIIGRNAVTAAGSIMNMKPVDYDNLQVDFSAKYLLYKLPNREMNHTMKKQRALLDKLEQLFVVDYTLLADDICSVLTELENNRPSGEVAPDLALATVDAIATLLCDVAMVVSDSHDPFSSELIVHLRSLECFSERAVSRYFLENLFVTPTLFKVFAAFFINSIDSLQKEVHSGTVAFQYHRSNVSQLCSSLNLILQCVGCQSASLPLSIDGGFINNTIFEVRVQWLRELFLTLFRFYRQLFCTVPFGLLFYEVSLPSSFMKSNRSVDLLEAAPSSLVGLRASKTNLLTVFFFLVQNYIYAENRAAAEYSGARSNQSGKVFQLLLSALREILESSMIETKDNPHDNELIFSVVSEYTSSIMLLLLRRQLLLRDQCKASLKATAEVTTVLLKFVQCVLVLTGQEAVFSEIVHSFCMSFGSFFRDDYKVSFMCTQAPIRHQCTILGASCCVDLRAADVSLLLRNTILSFSRNENGKESSRASSFMSNSAKTNRERTTRLNDIFAALNNFIMNGGDAAKNPLLVWGL